MVKKKSEQEIPKCNVLGEEATNDADVPAENATAEEPKNAPEEVQKLPREAILEMQNFHLRREKLQGDIANVGLQIENHERAKTIAILKRNDLKNSQGVLKAQYDAFLERVKSTTGIDIRNKTINPETCEVT